MRRLALQMQMSVDGFVSSANPSLGWQLWNWGQDWPWDDALKARFNSIISGVDTILLSRKMAEEGYLDHWGSIAKLAMSDRSFEFAQRIVSVKKVVLSEKLTTSKWPRTQVRGGPMTEVIASLKRERGRDIICFGGVGFASALVSEGLVDELQCFVNPVAVGAGRSIFSAQRNGLELELTDSKAYDCGMVVNCYSPRNGHLRK